MPSLRSLFTAASFAFLLPLAAMAQTPAAAPAVIPPADPLASQSVTRGELPTLVRDALLSNPEMIKEAVKKLREKEEAEAKKKTDEALTKHKDALFNDPASPSVGNPKADVVVVEYFDYHCGYCRHMLPTIVQLLKEDKNVRVVFKEYPILSEDSVLAARTALAVHAVAPDKYFDYHSALMKLEGKFDEKNLLAAVKKIGVSSEKVKAEMAKPSVTEALDKTRALGVELGITGTPAIVIGNTVLPGAMSYEELKKMVDNARSGKPPTEPAAVPAPAN